MALGDVLARLLSLAAFILTLIVIFAGTQSSGALDDIYLIFVSQATNSASMHANHRIA